MQLSDQSQAILLLTAWLGRQEHADVTPLTPTEWGRFARFLHENGKTPADLLRSPESGALLAGGEDRIMIPGERIRGLLRRSAALGLALEKWQRAGLWIMTRSDVDYPRRWKQRLRNDAPPVLFGVGNRDLLNRGGIAVVGSRDLDESQVTFTGRLGRDIAYQGQTVVSGGARGADAAAMMGALEAEGTAIGVLVDSLLRTSTSSRYRKALMSNDLALVSPFNPEAGFNVGNAMARNKYIYCLSDAAIVIAATENKGGTWSGAVENLRRGWVPLWVRQGHLAGNRALVNNGAHWLPDVFDVRQLMAGRVKTDEQVVAAPRMTESAVAYESRPTADRGAPSAPVQDAGEQPEANLGGEASEIGAATDKPQELMLQDTPYRSFIHRLDALLGERAMSLKELQVETRIGQKQLSEWLKRAVADGVAVKTRSPVKYRLRIPEGTRPHNVDQSGKDGKSANSGGNGDAQKSFGF
ncbi:MAG: DNA-processing protein DprA [Pseudomonadota bacterium]